MCFWDSKECENIPQLAWKPFDVWKCINVYIFSQWQTPCGALWKHVRVVWWRTRGTQSPSEKVSWACISCAIKSCADPSPSWELNLGDNVLYLSPSQISGLIWLNKGPNHLFHFPNQCIFCSVSYLSIALPNTELNHWNSIVLQRILFTVMSLLYKILRILFSPLILLSMNYLHKLVCIIVTFFIHAKHTTNVLWLYPTLHCLLLSPLPPTDLLPFLFSCLFVTVEVWI